MRMCTDFVDCVSHASKYQISFAHFRLSHVFFIFMCVCVCEAVKLPFYEALSVFSSSSLGWRLVNSKRWFCVVE